MKVLLSQDERKKIEASDREQVLLDAIKEIISKTKHGGQISLSFIVDEPIVHISFLNSHLTVYHGLDFTEAHITSSSFELTSQEEVRDLIETLKEAEQVKKEIDKLLGS